MAISALLYKYLLAGLKRTDTTYYGFPEENLWGANGIKLENGSIRQVFPVVYDLVFGERIIEVNRNSVIGEGRAGSGASYDIPLIAVQRDLGYSVVEHVYAGAEWAMDEVAQAIIQTRTTGRQNTFIAEQIEGVRIALDRRVHRLSLEGLPDRGVYGVFNNPNVPQVDLTATIDLGSMTSDAILAWIQTQLLTFSTALSVNPGSLWVYVGKEVYEHMIKPFSSQNPTSVSTILTTTPGMSIGGIQYLPELSHDFLQELGVFASGDNKARIFIGPFNDSRAVVRHAYAVDRTPPFTKGSGIHFGVTGFCSSTGVEFKLLEKFKYLDVKVTPKAP